MPSCDFPLNVDGFSVKRDNSDSAWPRRVSRRISESAGHWGSFSVCFNGQISR